MPISKENYLNLWETFGTVASWAIWKYPGDKAKSNTSDMSVFDSPKLLELLNPNYVFVALNGSDTHGKRYDGKKIWTNFHSCYTHQQDYKLRFALMNTPYWGSYLTDIFKNYYNINSIEVMKKYRTDKAFASENILKFKKELSLLGGKPLLVAMGSYVYAILKKHFGKDYTVVKVWHYSYRCGKEQYRENVLSALKNC